MVTIHQEGKLYRDLAVHKSAGNKITKILVPVSDDRETFHGLDMAFLISSKINCEITLAYLLPVDQYVYIKNHRTHLVDIIENKIRPELKFAHKWNTHKESIHFVISKIEDSTALNILQLAEEGAFDLVTMWVPHSRKHFLGPVFAEKPVTLRVMQALDCPLICLSEKPAECAVENILFPVICVSDALYMLEKTTVISAALQSHISLLSVLENPSEREMKEASELLELCVKYLKKQNISSTSKVIAHHDTFGTILAYASIVRAGLISNGFCDKESFNSLGMEQLSKKIMLHSHLPTYNYYYKQI
jgi:hypothetical protein